LSGKVARKSKGKGLRDAELITISSRMYLNCSREFRPLPQDTSQRTVHRYKFIFID